MDYNKTNNKNINCSQPNIKDGDYAQELIKAISEGLNSGIATEFSAKKHLESLKAKYRRTGCQGLVSPANSGE